MVDGPSFKIPKVPWVRTLIAETNGFRLTTSTSSAAKPSWPAPWNLAAQWYGRWIWMISAIAADARDIRCSRQSTAFCAIIQNRTNRVPFNASFNEFKFTLTFYKLIISKTCLDNGNDNNESSESISIWAPNLGKGIRCSNGSFRAHEDECSKYYQCVNGQWMAATCPGGLYWNRVRIFRQRFVEFQFIWTFPLFRAIVIGRSTRNVVGWRKIKMDVKNKTRQQQESLDRFWKISFYLLFIVLVYLLVDHLVLSISLGNLMELFNFCSWRAWRSVTRDYLFALDDVVVISHIKNIQSLQILSKRNFDSLSLSNRFLKSNWLVHEHLSCWYDLVWIQKSFHFSTIARHSECHIELNNKWPLGIIFKKDSFISDGMLPKKSGYSSFLAGICCYFPIHDSPS